MSDASIPEWINAISAAAGAFAVVLGLFGAKQTIDANRDTRKAIRKSEVAEELIALSLNAENALRDIRNPFDRIPEEKLHDPQFLYQNRYKRIVNYNDLFNDLREAQIRVRAVVGNAEVDAAVEKLFKARNRVAVALELIAEYIRDGDDLDPESREQMREFKRDIYGSFSSKDEFGNEILSAVKKIEEVLTPIARLD